MFYIKKGMYLLQHSHPLGIEKHVPSFHSPLLLLFLLDGFSQAAHGLVFHLLDLCHFLLQGEKTGNIKVLWHLINTS